MKKILLFVIPFAIGFASFAQQPATGKKEDPKMSKPSDKKEMKKEEKKEMKKEKKADMKKADAKKDAMPKK